LSGLPGTLQPAGFPWLAPFEKRLSWVRRSLGNGMPTACPWEFHVRRYTGGHPQMPPVPQRRLRRRWGTGGVGAKRVRV